MNADGLACIIKERGKRKGFIGEGEAFILCIPNICGLNVKDTVCRA